MYRGDFVKNPLLQQHLHVIVILSESSVTLKDKPYWVTWCRRDCLTPAPYACEGLKCFSSWSLIMWSISFYMCNLTHGKSSSKAVCSCHCTVISIWNFTSFMTYITALDPPTFHQVDRRQIPPLISYLLPRQLRKETTTRLYIEGLTECGYFRDLTGISWLILMNLCDLESYVLVQFVFVLIFKFYLIFVDGFISTT